MFSSKDGKMIILSSPSGAGKTTLVKKISKEKNFKISVSHTTRKPRPNEINGTDYFFTTQKNFEELIKENSFLEHAKVFDNLYGSTKEQVFEYLKNGQNVLFDIDWQGTQQLADANSEDLVSVFILPPSMRDLEKRLLNRAQDSADIVAARMSKASDEISHYREYDYILVNVELDQSVSEVKAILHAERLRRDRQVGLTDFVKQLRSGY